MTQIFNSLSTIRALVYSLSVICFLVFRLGGFTFLAPVLSILSVVAIAISISKADWLVRVFTIFFLGAGTWLVLQKQISLYQYLLTFGEMLYLLSLFAMLPLLALPIRIGRYEQAIEQILGEQKNSPSHFYRIISSISFLLSFLNLATLPIMYQSVKTSAQKVVKTNTDKFVARAIIHGYTVSVTWTPFSGVVGVVLEITKVTWQNIFPILILISLAALILNWFIYSASSYLAKRQSAKEQPDQDDGQTCSLVSGKEIAATENVGDPEPHPMRRILEIVGVIIALILLVVVLNHFLAVGVVVTATVIAAPVAFLWAAILKETGAFLQATRSYIFNNIPGMAEQFALFLSAGFFIKALHFSGYNQAVNQVFVDFNHLVGGNMFLILLPLITMSFCFIGMHPIAAITLLAESLNPAILGITPEHMTIALIGGAVMTFMIGPFSGTMGVMSSIIKVNPFRIAAWSIIPAIGFFLILVLVLLLY